ncbi:alpha-amylase family glycosyl hydrolase [Sinomicrobium weinanense]|uniref:Alpha-glucosidase C-terminal domain-containing protein n=1 Tax=Sinomicrobium weinanense TaxID=2842200 RepID=A0A926JVE8_9FLAO|nr:alpha-amylase family glycosyl hydrolase [Sinomicrobium weinanense]MBC9798287.1 alpha-glucosidase C-terminal domain-containing protein [Sinomicrobium weinanense]MBU3125097.1 alpha-glucosidase C-terminal domain-containing protein [Sinomicrobium weinanense]
MKKILIITIAIFSFVSCKKEEKKQVGKAEPKTELAPVSDEILETAVIYEANIRQYSEEGSFNAFTQDIPKLKGLGVKVIWLMPVYPISSTKSKGSLGSYYAITDYTKVNPEFGTLEDFRKLIKTAHDNGIYVILDWVANHTGWDHVWIEQRPEYYTQDKEGHIIDPINPETGESWDWTDVADLNYDNHEMREEMIKDMRYWIEEENIDGYRCDVAHQVPVDFWEEAADRLREVKPVFMLAEAEQPELLKNAFDMQYAWEGHHLLNEIAQGKKNVKDWDAYMVKNDTLLEADDIFMNFTSNHDENSWNGTVFERMGDAAETFAAMTYAIPGMPLIYSGQEYDMDKRLLFFEKDTINKEKGKFYPLYEKLGKLKNGNKALNGGKKAASYKRLSTSDDEKVLAFVREKDGDRVVFIANLSAESLKFTVETDGEYKNYMTGEEMQINAGTPYDFKPWQYLILVGK